MKFKFAIVFTTMGDCTMDNVPIESASEITVEESTFDGAILLVQTTLASEDKTLKTLRLLVIEV